MFKNVASQSITLLVIDTANNIPKTGDASNLTFYQKIDGGSVTALTASPTEDSATNAPGLYTATLTQAETNGDVINFSGKSSTADIRVVPVIVRTSPPFFSSTSIDSSGRLDVAKWGGTAVASANVLIDSGITAAKIDTGAFTAAKFASGAFDAVWEVSTRTLSSFGTLIADIWAYVSRTITGTVTLATSQPNYAPAKAGDAMTLTSGERTAVANEVEAQIIDDTDSEKVLQAIVDKIAAVNPSLDDLTLGGIASAVRTELAVELARINATISSRASQTSVDTMSDTTNSVADDAQSIIGIVAGIETTSTSAAANSQSTLSEIGYARTDIAAIPKLGESYRYTQDNVDEDNKVADVTITEVP